jgi:tripartite-type tricarboxylate transporter receptor subunit TctC
MNDAIAGHLDMLIGSAALVTPQVVAGKLRALAQTGRSRIAALPDTPTVSELGLGVESYAWWGVFTTGGTPKPIVARFSAALAETLREPAIQKQLSDNLKITVRLGGPQEQATFLSEQMKLWGPVVREHGIKGD